MKNLFVQAARAIIKSVIIGGAILISSAHAQTNEDSQLIVKHFQGYYDAYSKDSKLAATYYGEPVLLVSKTSVKVMATRTEVEDYLSKGLAGLKPLGYAYSGLGEYHIKYLNDSTALFNVVAMRYKADGTEQMRAGFTYLVRKEGAGWKIHANMATDEDKLIK